MSGLFSRNNLIVTGFALIALGTGDTTVQAQQNTQCFSIEFFYDSNVNDAAELRSGLESFAKERSGLVVHVRDVNDDEASQKRVNVIAKHFRISSMKLPAIYGLKNVIADIKTEEQLRKRLKEILLLTAYVRNGCPHCRDTKAFLAKYRSRYPALEIKYREVITDASANREMQAVVRRYQRSAASLPVIHYCNGLTIGFDREATTGKRILQTLDYWSNACQSEKKK